MVVVYIVVVPFVIALLLGAILFPFWKVLDRMKTHHQDIWQSAGPFELDSMIRSPGLAGIFITVLTKMNRDKELQAKDPLLAKWVRGCIEVIQMVPRTISGRIGFAVIFVVFAFGLTKFLIEH